MFGNINQNHCNIYNSESEALTSRNFTSAQETHQDVIQWLLTCLAGQSDRDTSNSSTSQDSQPGKPSGMEAVVIVTPDLLTAQCGLLYNLLAVLPDFTLTAIQENQLLPVLSR